MANFAMKNNLYEFNGDVKQEKSAKTISTKFAPLYACIFTNEVETKFLKRQKSSPFPWFIIFTRYVSHEFLGKKVHSVC